MRAALLYGPGDLRIGEVPDPEPGPHDVVVDVACVQPSVTECMLIGGDKIALHERLARALRRGPVRFGGHEFAGVVSAVGEGVTATAPGDRVTAIETVTCGQCAPCRLEQSYACTSPHYIGFTRPGAFAERVLVPERCVVPVPRTVGAGAAAAIQPLTGAIHALAGLVPGESVLVIGAGVMGLLSLQVARRHGAGFIAISGRSPAKLALAERFGADLVLNAADDVAAAVGDGVDVVVETAGGSPAVGLAGTETLDLATRCVRRGGRIVVVSVLPDHAPVPLGRLRGRSASLVHPRNGGREAFDHALRLVARGDVDVEALVTHRLRGIDELIKAVDITRDKATHGAINPAQVFLDAEHAWDS